VYETLDLLGMGGKVVSSVPVAKHGGMILGPGGMTVAKDGTIYIADALTHRVLVLKSH